ncbi:MULTISPECIES: CynX/NimT family MFS transporter [unclassified Arthrobacter]|uniref:MFS transporter n=1 Tax=unclassified Arthrobacter TaxID=235627 RepID=UPI001C84C00E|nr:MFS transporter [Arthrobacter sp. MAHUQ-56]MBX7445970.1 MFS transporter [Arthrobacter sp. MAHUQ-56]
MPHEWRQQPFRTDRDLRRRYVRAGALTLITVGLAALNTRAPLVGLGPVLGSIQQESGLSTAAAGLLTAIPVLCFGLVTPATGWLIGRIGLNHAMLYFFAALGVGIFLRSFAGTPGAIFGTVMIGIGMTIMNVATPLFIGRDFPMRAALLTGLTTAAANVGTTLAAAFTAPLAGVVGWRWALFAWAGITAIAAGAWLLVFPPFLDHPRWSTRRQAQSVNKQPAATTYRKAPVSKRSNGTKLSSANRRMMLYFTAAFAFHNMAYYAITLWLPSFLMETRAMASSEAGVAASLFQLLAIIGPLLIPLLTRVLGWGAQGLFITVASCWIILPSGLLAAPQLWPLWAALGGIAQGGTFTVIFTVVIERAPSLAENRRMTAFIQSIGYGIAASGPVLMGLIRDVAGGWTPPLLLIVGALIIMAACGVSGIRTSSHKFSPSRQPDTPAAHSVEQRL